jgi:putative phosphoribosyl transferase
MEQKYRDRQEAGKILAEHLKAYAHRKDTIILALPRGGVPVAYEMAKVLHVPLDIFLVRKLGVPGHEELAMGAVAMGNVTVFNEDVIQSLTLSKSAIDHVLQKEQQELKRRELLYRGKRPFPDLKNKAVILVDDGIATGATMFAAIKALHQFKLANLVVAVPVAEPSICEEMAHRVDKIVCPLKPRYFNAVGGWYDHFDQTTDQEVQTLLNA